MAFTGNLGHLTELEAINWMLSVIGESPIANADTATAPDVVMARNILKNALRQVLEVGWAFNTDFGLELAPSATFAWTGSDGKSETLNVWIPAANAIRAEVTKSAKQAHLDLVIRPSRHYVDANNNHPLVFFDRSLNRDGLEQTKHPVLHVNMVEYFQFEFIPQCLRDLVALTAARRFAGHVTGSQTAVGLTERDEVMAWRRAKQEQGQTDQHNIFDNPSVSRILGGRPYHKFVSLDGRSSPRRS